MAAPTPDVTCELTSPKVGFSKRRRLVQMKAVKPTDISLFRKDASEPMKSRHWVNFRNRLILAASSALRSPCSTCMWVRAKGGLNG